MSLLIDDGELRRLFAAWSVPLPRQPLILFALRGCLPTDKPKGWLASLKVTSIKPDYGHMRCTLGIWNQKTGKVFAVPGSTVPHRDNVVKAAVRKGGRGTNQIEPGFYTDLHKGVHLQGKPMGHAALRQTGYRFYRRSSHAPPYTSKDPLYFGNPYDNLHCAWNIDPEAEGFRSAGCMVIAGWPHSPRLPDSKPNRGPWKLFHDLIYTAPQNNFPMLLLPAKEAFESLQKKNRPGLCYGSQGDMVKDLQKFLSRKNLYAGPINGKLGVATYRAWNASGFISPV